MAETAAMATTTASKRHSTAGGSNKVPVATPSIGNMSAANMVPLETALSTAVGARIRLTTISSSEPLEGTLFTADPITNLLALTTGTSTYTVIPIPTIASFTIVSLPTRSSTTFAALTPSIHNLDIPTLRAREAAAVATAKEREARRGKGVTKEGQDVFDALVRTLPVQWDGKKVVVMSAVVIEPPYRVEDCKALEGKSQGVLSRVKKIVEGERRKTMEKARAGRDGAAQRKGG